MQKSKEIEFTTTLLESLGNNERIKLLQKSNLTLREQHILAVRYIDGLTIKEAAEKLNMVEITYIKNQQRALQRLYSWIKNKEVVNQIYNLLMDIV